jgi:ABC-type transporter Mla subunit MlaD
VPVGTYAEIGESITGSVKLHLKPGLSDRNLKDEDTKKEPIPGVEGTNLAQLSEKLGTLIDTFGKMAEGAGDVLLEAKALLSTLKAKVDSIDTAAIGLDVKQAVASLRRVVEGVEAKIGTIVGNVDQATADLKAMAGKGSALLDDAGVDVKELLATLKEVAKRLDRLLERAAPQVEAFLASMTRAAGSFDALARDLGGIGPDARGLLKGLGADVTELVATLQDTAHNLLDTSEDVKSRPWILLNEPDEQEMAFENVRIATQNYAKAMQEMNSAADRLVKLSQSPSVNDPETRRLIQESLARFRSSQERYQRVEQALLQALQQTAPRPNAPR